MTLYIKNEEVAQLAKQLVELTGETLTEAVTKALRERLEQVLSEQPKALADRLLWIGKDCAAHLKEPFRSADHGDLLHDDTGLPR